MAMASTSSRKREHSSTKPDETIQMKRQKKLRTVDEFETVNQVGEGTFGRVFKARDKLTNELVALKMIRMENEKEGFPITAIREIKILKQLEHENIVKLKEIIVSNDSNLKMQDDDRSKPDPDIFMVFEYIDHDLTGLMDSPEVHFTPTHIKYFMKQLLNGVFFMHTNHILHRDLKGSNILINGNGQLKIADWGLARALHPNNSKYTNKVITLWYRPPELLMGAREYSSSIDMWSIGCIFAEMMNKVAILRGRDENDQLEKIFDLCGTPTPENWPNVAQVCPEWVNYQNKEQKPRVLRETYPNFENTAFDLLDKFMTLNPLNRIDAHSALNHMYFWNDEIPEEFIRNLRFNVQSAHEWETRIRKGKHQNRKHQNANRQNPRNYIQENKK